MVKRQFRSPPEAEAFCTFTHNILHFCHMQVFSQVKGAVIFGSRRFSILPERDYVTFGSAIANPSVVCLSSVTFERPTQGG